MKHKKSWEIFDCVKTIFSLPFHWCNVPKVPKGSFPPLGLSVWISRISWGNINQTRLTFFRVKLVFEFEFEISWSSGPLDLWTQRPWDSWTLGLWDLFPPPPPPPIPSSYTSLPPFIFSFSSFSPNSFHFLLHPFTSFYLFLSPITSWFGMVWYGGVVIWLWSFLSFDIGDWYLRWTLDLYINV